MQEIQEVEVQNLEFSNSHPKRAEKELLLEEYDAEINRVKNISLKTLLFVFLAITFVLVLLLPKIYISNQIYYTSKNINNLYHKYTALKEEHAHLKQELESLHYKLEILDELDGDE